MPPEIDDAILEAMDRYGGSFVVALAHLYRRADADNRATLRGAFARYFEEYAALVARARNAVRRTE